MLLKAFYRIAMFTSAFALTRQPEEILLKLAAILLIMIVICFAKKEEMPSLMLFLAFDVAVNFFANLDFRLCLVILFLTFAVALFPHFCCNYAEDIIVSKLQIVWIVIFVAYGIIVNVMN